MQAQAVVAVAAGAVTVQTVEVPDPGPHDVVVRVAHSWISPGTEGSFIRGERKDGETPLGPDDPQPFPHVPGYQKVGMVEWAGAAVTDLAVGDMVAATISHVSQMAFPFGGHVSPAVTHRSQVWKVPPGVDPVALSGFVLAQVGYNCAMRPVLAAGDAAVVLGDGLVGQWAAQALAWRGARVLLIGRHDARLAAFASGPGDAVCNARTADPVAVARAWAPQGLQVLVDTVGSVASLTAFLALLRRDGQIVSAGFNGTHGALDIQLLRQRELTLHAPSGWTSARIAATIELIADGRLQTLQLITHRFPVSAAAEAYALILERQVPFLGVVLDW